MFKRVTVYKVRVVYKSGYIHDFETAQFSLKNGVYSCGNYDDTNKPIELGGSEIAAVWQIGYRKVWKRKQGRMKW